MLRHTSYMYFHNGGWTWAALASMKWGKGGACALYAQLPIDNCQTVNLSSASQDVLPLVAHVSLPGYFHTC